MVAPAAQKFRVLGVFRGTHYPFPIPHYSLLITLNLFVVAPMAQIVFANATMIIARYILYVFEDVIYLCA